MKTGVALFVSSTIFGAAIATAYWYSSHHWGGTLLLGFMAAALGFAAGWAVLAEREAQLDGDNPRMTQEQARGEDLGIFTSASAWPILAACSVLVMLLGLLFSPFMVVAGLLALVLVVWRMGAESARIGSPR